jgi:hypothetical protein
MTARARHSKQDATAWASATLSQAMSLDSLRSDIPHRAASSRQARIQRTLGRAGNAAINQLLSQQNEGQPLDQKTLAEMERACGADFRGVLFHDDPAAQASAASLGAAAFTRGDDVYLGKDAPSPESLAGKSLVAHELAHVVQQRQAGTVDAGRINQPDEGSERAANAAGQKAAKGQTASVATAGGVPEVQRQEKDPGPLRADIEAALEKFLQGVVRKQGGGKLRVTPEVRIGIKILFSKDPILLTQIDLWLNRSDVPQEPAEFAHQVASQLPEPEKIDPELLRQLNRLSGRPEAQSLVERFRGLAPGSPRGEARVSDPSRGPSSQELFERGVGLVRRQRGESTPTQFGPNSIDVLQGIRMAEASAKAGRGRKHQHGAPGAGADPKVEEAIQQLVQPDALIPADVAQRRRQAESSFDEAGPQEEKLRRLGIRDARAVAESYADAREVARELARLLDVAHQQGQTDVDLYLSPIYNDVRDRRTIYSELKPMASIICSRLPHHASSVSRLIVWFGKTEVTRIVLNQSE